MIGANITDSGILGFDFLKQHKCNIDIGKEELMIMGMKVPCQKESSGKSDMVYKVSLKEAHVLPPLTESVLPAVIRRIAGTIVSSTNVLLQPQESFTEEYGVVMAASLCDSIEEKVHVRVLNPTVKDIWLFKGTVMGYAQSLEGEIGQMGKEDEEKEEDRCISVRRIGVRNDVIVENQSTVMDDGIASKQSGWPSDCVKHVENAYQNENISTEQEQLSLYIQMMGDRVSVKALTKMVLEQATNMRSTLVEATEYNT